MKNQVSLKTSVSSIPMRDFFKNPEKTGYKISPDGSHISFLGPYQNRLNIFVSETGKEEAVRASSITDKDIMFYFWKNNSRIIYLRDNNGDENYHLFAVDKDGRNAKELTPFEGVKVEIIDELEDNEKEMLVGTNQRDPQVFDAFRLNVENGEMVLVAENPGNISKWITDHDGSIRAAIVTDGVNSSLLYRHGPTGEFTNVLTTSFRDTLAPLFFTFDNKLVYAISNLGRDKHAAVKYDFANAKELEVIYEHPDVDVQSLDYSRKRKVITDVTFITWKTERAFLDEQTKKIYERIENELKGFEVVITDKNKAEDKFIIRTYSDRSLGAYFLYDLGTDKLTRLAEVSPWLKEEDLCEMKPIEYRSRDGLKINGYLTLPNGVEPKNLPVVVNPHGGPWHRDVWTYNPEIQFLANRGYAVLQMNFRGSLGYGREFWEISFKQWGKKMQDDISDGVKWLIGEGIADPKRIAIYGGSYGGYATLAGLTFSPELYACGIDYVGVSNLFTFMKSIPEYWKPQLEMLYEMVGNPENEKELMESASPVFHVDKIKAPLFVAQGRMDPRVNVNESDQMVEALKKRGIDVPYMVKDNEGHGFNNEENKFDFYEAMEKFLADHMKS